MIAKIKKTANGLRDKFQNLSRVRKAIVVSTAAMTLMVVAIFIGESKTMRDFRKTAGLNERSLQYAGYGTLEYKYGANLLSLTRTQNIHEESKKIEAENYVYHQKRRLVEVYYKEVQ